MKGILVDTSSFAGPAELLEHPRVNIFFFFELHFVLFSKNKKDALWL